MRDSPSAASPASAMSVTVVLRLVRAFDGDADVVRLVLGQLAEPDAERVQVQPGHLLVQVLGQRVHAQRVLAGLGNSSTWAITWLVKLLDMTKLGCPVALPRFSRRPSDSTMMPCPSEKVHSSTCGLMLVWRTPGHFASPAMSISLSKWPMLPTIAWCFIRLMCSAVITSRLPVVVTKMSAPATTSSSVVTW